MFVFVEWEFCSLVYVSLVCIFIECDDCVFSVLLTSLVGVFTQNAS